MGIVHVATCTIPIVMYRGQAVVVEASQALRIISSSE